MKIKTIILVVVVVVGVLAGMTALLWNYSNEEELPIVDVAGVERHARGEGEIVITEFSDFQCPACAGVQSELKQLLARHEGKVRLVYRHLPLTSIHKHAVETAVMAEAAGEQGKFFEMHDKLFVKQSEWEGMDDVSEKLLEYAEELGLDMERLTSDLGRDELREQVLLDSSDAVKYKIQSTPSFFVDGVKVLFPALEGVIESKLAE